MPVCGREMTKTRRRKKVSTKNFAARKAFLISKRDDSFQKLLAATAVLTAYTKDSLLTTFFVLSSNTLEENFHHLGGKAGELPHQNWACIASEILLQ